MLQTVTAHQKYIRTSPRKLRLVADSLRRLPVDQALTKLKFTSKRASLTLMKVLIQAQKNAVNNSQLNPDTLVIHSITIDPGPTFKRWQPVSRGRAHSILKRTSHITILVKGDKAAAKPVAAIQKTASAVKSPLKPKTVVPLKKTKVETK